MHLDAWEYPGEDTRQHCRLVPQGAVLVLSATAALKHFMHFSAPQREAAYCSSSVSVRARYFVEVLLQFTP